MNEKKVSVVIAAHDAEEYIQQCIESIIAQTYTNWEIWVCDDFSSDNTLKILNNYAKKDDRIHVLHNNMNLYAGESRNRCIQASDGDYIVIQDADDISKVNRLEVLVKAIESGGFDFVSSGYYLFDEEGIYKTVIPEIEQPSNEDFLLGIPFCHAATLFSKQCLKSIGGYRVARETKRGQDYDMFMRLYAFGFKGKNIKDVLYGYRVDKNTISRRKLKYRIDECIIRYKGFKSLGLFPKGILYVLKPIPAYFVQLLRRR